MQWSTQLVNKTDWFFLAGSQRKVDFVSRNLASNKSALCRIAILAFSFFLISISLGVWEWGCPYHCDAQTKTIPGKASVYT